VRGSNKWFVIAGALMLVAASASHASAQLNTQHVKGSVGLKAGSEAPPGGYIVLPVFYIYNSDTIVKPDGSKQAAARRSCSVRMPTIARRDSHSSAR